MQEIDNPREHGQIGGSSGKVGTGSRIPLMTLKPKVPSFYTKDYVGTGTSISS